MYLNGPKLRQRVNIISNSQNSKKHKTRSYTVAIKEKRDHNKQL